MAKTNFESLPNFQMYIRDSSRIWKQARQAGGTSVEVLLKETSANNLLEAYIAEGRHQSIVDFDEHLDDITKWVYKCLIITYTFIKYGMPICCGNVCWILIDWESFFFELNFQGLDESNTFWLVCVMLHSKVTISFFSWTSAALDEKSTEGSAYLKEGQPKAVYVPFHGA